MRYRLILAALIILAAGFSASCGFRVLTGKTAPADKITAAGGYKKYNDISAIYIKPFKDMTYKSGYGAYFSGGLDDYLNTHTDIFTSSRSDALYYLTGKIISIQNSVMSYTGVAAAVDYMITVTVRVSLYKADGKIIFRNIDFSSSATYYNYMNPLTAHKQEKAAVKTVAGRIARKIAIYIESKRLT